jgi:carbon storage regulator CsrA
MVVITGAVGEEIIIDGRISVKILSIDGDEVRLDVNFPEFVRLDLNGAYGELMESRRWPASSA